MSLYSIQIPDYPHSYKHPGSYCTSIFYKSINLRIIMDRKLWHSLFWIYIMLAYYCHLIIPSLSLYPLFLSRKKLAASISLSLHYFFTYHIPFNSLVTLLLNPRYQFQSISIAIASYWFINHTKSIPTVTI